MGRLEPEDYLPIIIITVLMIIIIGFSMHALFVEKPFCGRYTVNQYESGDVPRRCVE